MPTGDAPGVGSAAPDVQSATEVPTVLTAVDGPAADSAFADGRLDAPESVPPVKEDAARPENETGKAEPGVDGAKDAFSRDTSQDEQAEAGMADALATDLAVPGDTLDGAGGPDGPGVCPAGGILVEGTDHCFGSGKGETGNLQWNLFSSSNPACLTTYGTSAAYSVTWSNSGDVVAELGPTLDGSKSYSALGTVTAEFTETKAGTAGAYSYIGIHGWSTNPLREYTIVEDWFGDGARLAGSKMATITVDGAPYDVYRYTQYGPSIIGTQTYDQYFSVRQSSRSCGSISVTEHFKRWEVLGLSLGLIHDLNIMVEVGGGSGRIDFSTAMISIQ